ncbi:MAG: hypothetical protein EXR58_01060 [Chloroflexi bacterium]|nr:hypothetical protein [Chloroflexota bacterium]
MADFHAGPEYVQIWYDGGILPTASFLKDFDATGTRVDADDSAVIGDDMDGLMVHLQPSLPVGIYSVAWQATADDGEQILDNYEFMISPELLDVSDGDMIEPTEE